MKSDISFKDHLAAFVPLADAEFEKIFSYFTQEKMRKGEHLIRAGEKVASTYWVKKGLLVSSFTDTAGKEHIIQFAIEHCWITDQQAFYNQNRAIFNIVCMENAELICLSFKNREKLCADFHKMEKFFRRKANDSFVKQQRRLLTYMTANAKDRFDLLQQEFPGILQRLSKKTLAAYLGVTRETLSRLRDVK